MSLHEELENVSRMIAEQAPPEMIEQFMNFIKGMAENGVTANAPQPGDKAPDFALPNAVGDTVVLDDLLSRGPAVVTFYRGRWCVYCNTALRALQRSLPEFEELGASLCAISPQTPDESLTMKEKAELEFEVLSDSGNAVAHQFGLAFEVPAARTPNRWSCGPPPASPGTIRRRTRRTRRATFWCRSMTGSRRASIAPTSRTPMH